MTQEEAATISRQITLIVRHISDVQVILPPGALLINGLCHSAMILLYEAQRECGKAIRGEEDP